MTFKTFITEAVVKNNHLEHVEDNAFEGHQGHQGFQHALDTLKAVSARVQGKPSNAKITTKYDGSPAVVFGHHDGKFFVGTKAALSAKPKLMKTPKDIDAEYGDRPDLAKKLKAALEHLPKVTPNKGVYQGDLMYTKPDVHEDDTHYHFTPNTLMYSTKKSTPEGQKIKHAKIGVVVHTKYHGKDLANMAAGFEPSLGEFKKHKDVHVINPELSIKSPLRDEASLNKFTKHIKDAENEIDRSHPDTFPETAMHSAHLKDYAQGTSRDGEKPTAQGFKAFLTNRVQKESEKLKTPTGKLRKKEQLLAHLSHVDEHHDKYQSLLTAHHHLAQAKDTLLDALKHDSDYETSVNGEETGHEGYVVHHQGKSAKLVKRSEFTRLNKLQHIKEETLVEGGNVKINGEHAVPVDGHHATDIHATLQHIHNTFQDEHAKYLFGSGAKALHHLSVYSGSSRHLAMGLAGQHPVGDIDLMVPKEHIRDLKDHLSDGRKFGHYQVVGTKLQGNELHALMRHKSGAVHQFDFEGVHYDHDEPTKGEQFIHSSSAQDRLMGIKGSHHKTLLHAAGGDRFKFSNSNGLTSRKDAKITSKDPEVVAHHLFGKDADAERIHSFTGVAHLIHKHLPASEHQKVYDKFKDILTNIKHTDHGPALEHLRKTLNLH